MLVQAFCVVSSRSLQYRFGFRVLKTAVIFDVVQTESEYFYSKYSRNMKLIKTTIKTDKILRHNRSNYVAFI